MDSVPSLVKTEEDDSDSRLAELTKMALSRTREGEKFTDYIIMHVKNLLKKMQ